MRHYSYQTLQQRDITATGHYTGFSRIFGFNFQENFAGLEPKPSMFVYGENESNIQLNLSLSKVNPTALSNFTMRFS